MTIAISASALQNLQERVKQEIPDRFRYARVLSVMALHEEIGELLEAISKAHSKTALDAELGDVFLSCLEIANVFEFKLTPPEIVDAEIDADAMRLCIAAGRVSKECLEIEGFDRPRHEQLLDALNDLLSELALFELSQQTDLVAAFENKFLRILKRIEDGTWDRLYGDTLILKRQKFD
jgi:NTP pyrophosphatase (non-canonical NTP hydrolase)